MLNIRYTIFPNVRRGLIIFFVLFPCALFGQYASFINYNLNSGLPSNTAYFILKDSKGYLWITTDRGLVKYDGYSFTTYTTTDGVSDNEIFEAYEDSKKRIWFSTFNGIPTIYSEGKFYSFEYLFKKYERVATGPCYRILEKDSSLWFLNRKAIYRVTNNRIHAFSAKKTTLSSMAYHEGWKKMYFLNSSVSWVISIDENNKLDTIPINISPSTNISKALIKDNFLYYTSWKNFCGWDLEHNTGFSVELGTELLSIQDPNNDTTLLIGASNGVYEFNIKNHSWREKFRDQPGISSIFIDSDRSYWTTSLNSGISFFGNEKVEILNNRNAIPFEYVSLVKKMGNRLLIASDKFRFCIYNLSTKKVEAYFDEADRVPGRGFANSMRKATNGDIYVSFRVVLIKIDKNGKISRIGLKEVSYDFIFTPDYYVAVHVDQISRRKSSESITGLSEDYESMALTGRHLFYDSTNAHMYAYGANGLFKVNVDSFNYVTNYSHYKQISTNVSTMAKFNDSLLIVGSTLSGIHFLKRDKIIAGIGIDQGLSSNYVNCVFVDGNEVWIGTDKGINVLTVDLVKANMNMYQLGKKDGIFNNEINDITIENDTVFVATPSGLFFFHRNNVNRIVEKPTLNIEYVTVNSESLELQEEYQLNPYQNNVKVKFTGISYNALGNIVYRYKLTPADDLWHYTTSREIEYPSLSPNEYTLVIQCKGNRGGWSEVRKIKFEIAPSFWQRTTVRILFVILFFVVIGLLVRIRFKAIKKGHLIKEKLLKLENEKLEDIKNQAIKDKELIELEQQALRLHMNPHFIFNAINAIQGFYAGNEVNKAKQFISYFSKLLRMILETSKEKLVPVSTEVEIIKNYLELFLLRFEDKYSYHIKLDPDIDSESIMIPPMVVQPFVENAVLHGISPMKTKGEINIDFELEEDVLKISIRDNGIGRKKSEELKMFSKSKSTGIKVTQMRLKHLNEQLNDGHLVEIIDLEEKGISIGTLVILRVPLSGKS